MRYLLLAALLCACDDGEAGSGDASGALDRGVQADGAPPLDARADRGPDPDADPADPDADDPDTGPRLDASADGAPDALVSDGRVADAAARPDAAVVDPDDFWTVAADFSEWDPAVAAARLRPRGAAYVGVVDLPAGPIEFKFAFSGDWAENLGGDGAPRYAPRRQADLVGDGPNLRAEVPIPGPWRFELEPSAGRFALTFAGAAGPAEQALLDGIERGEVPELESPAAVDGALVFLRDGPAFLATQANGWQEAGPSLAPTTGRLHYAARAVAERMPYRFVVDGDWIRDPRNPYVVWDGIERGGVGDFHSLAITPAALASPGGHLEWFALNAPDLGGERDVFVWVPHGYEACHWLTIHDGNESITRGHFDEVLDARDRAGDAAPLSVFVALADQNRRLGEYGLPVDDPEIGAAEDADAYVALLADTLVPLIEARYDVGGARDCRGIIGASVGGLISVYAAWQRPQVWRRIGAQSGSFFWGDRWMIRAIADAERRDYVFYIDSGEPRDNADVTRALAQVLEEKGYPFTHREEPGGQHDWAFWRGRFGGAVEGLLQ